jgi:predicted DsbA family dithiol-disulfide isomerase
MQRLLFLEQSLVSSEQFPELAAQAGLDAAVFRECYDSGRQKKVWQSDKSEGAAIGVSSTPTVFINGRMIAGARTYEVLRDIVEEEIRIAQSNTAGRAESPSDSRAPAHFN